MEKIVWQGPSPSPKDRSLKLLYPMHHPLPYVAVLYVLQAHTERFVANWGLHVVTPQSSCCEPHGGKIHNNLELFHLITASAPSTFQKMRETVLVQQYAFNSRRRTSFSTAALFADRLRSSSLWTIMMMLVMVSAGQHAIIIIRSAVVAAPGGHGLSGHFIGRMVSLPVAPLVYSMHDNTILQRSVQARAFHTITAGNPLPSATIPNALPPYSLKLNNIQPRVRMCVRVCLFRAPSYPKSSTRQGPETRCRTIDDR